MLDKIPFRWPIENRQSIIDSEELTALELAGRTAKKVNDLIDIMNLINSPITGVNVMNYGAKGDGTTDDTAAIQEAFNSSPSMFASVYFPPGTYVISATLMIPYNNMTISGNAKIIAKSSANFEHMIRAVSRTGIVIRGLEFDVNQATRVSTQNTRFCGISFESCIDSSIEFCIVRNTLGYNSNPAVGVGISVGLRITVRGCRFIDCGGLSGTNASDGVYSFGDQTLIDSCIAINCTDTAFVLEASNYGIISNCTALNCSVGAGITNFTVNDKVSNMINGLVIRNWKAINNGAIQVGCIGAATGNLVDTIITDVIISADKSAGFGVGPGIRVRTDGGGRVKQLDISNVVIDGTTLTGISVDGDIVRIKNCSVKNTGDSCVGFDSGFEHFISGCYLHGGSFGLSTGGTASVVAQSNTMEGYRSWGIYAFGTSIIKASMNNLLGGDDAVGNVNKDSGATIDLIGQIGAGLCISNNTTNPPPGTPIDSFGVYDKSGNVLGYIPIYPTS